jgi:hypothetical protein
MYSQRVSWSVGRLKHCCWCERVLHASLASAPGVPCRGSCVGQRSRSSRGLYRWPGPCGSHLRLCHELTTGKCKHVCVIGAGDVADGAGGCFTHRLTAQRSQLACAEQQSRLFHRATESRGAGLETAVEHLHLPRTHDWERRARVNTWSAGLIVQAGVYSMHHLMPPCVPNTCGNDLIPALNIRELERHSGSGHVIARRCEFTPGKGEHMRTRAPPADRPM